MKQKRGEGDAGRRDHRCQDETCADSVSAAADYLGFGRRFSAGGRVACVSVSPSLGPTRLYWSIFFISSEVKDTPPKSNITRAIYCDSRQRTTLVCSLLVITICPYVDYPYVFQHLAQMLRGGEVS